MQYSDTARQDTQTHQAVLLHDISLFIVLPATSRPCPPPWSSYPATPQTNARRKPETCTRLEAEPAHASRLVPRKCLSYPTCTRNRRLLRHSEQYQLKQESSSSSMIPRHNHVQPQQNDKATKSQTNVLPNEERRTNADQTNKRTNHKPQQPQPQPRHTAQPSNEPNPTERRNTQHATQLTQPTQPNPTQHNTRRSDGRSVKQTMKGKERNKRSNEVKTNERTKDEGTFTQLITHSLTLTHFTASVGLDNYSLSLTHSRKARHCSVGALGLTPPPLTATANHSLTHGRTVNEVRSKWSVCESFH